MRWWSCGWATQKARATLSHRSKPEGSDTLTRQIYVPCRRLGHNASWRPLPKQNVGSFEPRLLIQLWPGVAPSPFPRWNDWNTMSLSLATVDV
jgi:hypothetical protein